MQIKQQTIAVLENYKLLVFMAKQVDKFPGGRNTATRSFEGGGGEGLPFQLHT